MCGQGRKQGHRLLLPAPGADEWCHQKKKRGEITSETPLSRTNFPPGLPVSMFKVNRAFWDLPDILFFYLLILTRFSYYNRIQNVHWNEGINYFIKG